jgi:elongation factor 1-alpha
MAAAGKEHMSVVICGHVDSGKSTTTGHLLYQLGGINERDMAKLKAEATTLGKDSFCFAFFMDKTKEERARGITIMCTLKDFYTPKYHYTIIDAPGHRDFMKNMISGASQADVAVLMVPADGNFATSLAKGDAKAGEVKGQTREHARLLNLLGVKQLVICINKMDSDLAKYSEARYNEIRDEIRNVLIRVGWRKDFVMASVPVLPISGWKGDNLFAKSEAMPWWTGASVKAQDGSTVNVVTLHDALNEFTQPAARQNDKPLRFSVNGVYNIKGVGNVISGKVEQGVIKPGQEVVFLPTHTESLPCTGRVFTVEMHHTSIPVGECGFNIGMSIKGLNKDNMPKVGDIMVLKSDDTLKAPKRFTVDVQVLDHPGELKKGYAPIAHCRTAKAPAKLVEIKWKVGKETAGKKLENPISIKANEMARLVFEVDPKHPIIVDKFESTEVLARVAFMDGNQAVMLGRVVDVEH